MLKLLLNQLTGRPRRPAVATPSRAPAGTLSAGPPIELPTQPPEAPASLRRGLGAREDVTLLLPTVAHRVELLRSTLEFLALAMPGVQVVVSDHTEDGDREAVSALVARYRALRARVLRHPSSWHFLERLCACAETATTPYVVVHADDDFMLPAALDEAAAFLRANPGHVGCQGRTFFYKLHAPGICVPKVNRTMSRVEADAAQRIAGQCTNFTPTLYALTRRDAFVRANRAALDFTTNVVFWQYLSSCLLLGEGKVAALDSLYYLRLDNPAGWRATLVREGDRTHWPHLVVAPEFSAELAKFKEGLVAALRTARRADTDELVDKCCLALVRRAFNPVWEHESAELELLARASQAGSDEHELIRCCAMLSREALRRMQIELPVRTV